MTGLYFSTFPAIILLGEPKRWESSLQLIIDLLRTNGKPDHLPKTLPEEHLPVIACNMDLEFMDRACIPRYGHGAYLLCLEALYKVSRKLHLSLKSLSLLVSQLMMCIHMICLLLLTESDWK